MIDLYFSPTPNGHKVLILLEEIGLDYRLIDIEALDGRHFNPGFVRISPNAKMPAIVDHAPADGGPPFAVFESGAILIYLADKAGRFLPTELRARSEVLQWLMWQMASLGPMSGQNGHFRHQAPPATDAYAPERYAREVRRLYALLELRLHDRGLHDRGLQDRAHVCGEYSIADIACHPWIAAHAIQGIDLGEFPALARWLAAVAARPAVARAYATGPAYGPSARLDEAGHTRRYRQTAEMLRAAHGE